jgi:hypothetical protein
MKIPSFVVTQHFTNEVDWILDLVVGFRLPSLDDDSCTNHFAYSDMYSYKFLWGSGATRVGRCWRFLSPIE